MSELKLSLAASAVQVIIQKTDGTEDALELREMTAANRDLYMDALKNRLDINADGSTRGIKRFNELQGDLISRCLFRTGVAVTLKEIQQWPSSVVQALYNAAQKLNKIGKEAGDVADDSKNE
jgi:hypothetical protein